MTHSFSHLTTSGDANMVDVSDKQITQRTAKARAMVVFPLEVYQTLRQTNGQTKKGVITDVARIAGIMAAKKTWDIIPLCHPLMIEKCDIDFNYLDEVSGIEIITTVKVTHKTGVEMEALTAASVAALTIYDMCKALSHAITIGQIELISKKGGKSDV